jgi:amino acid adenylation domain-containing protein
MLTSSAGPEVRPATLASLLRGRAGERPGKVAFTFLADGEAEGERLTYGELDRRARTIAAALRASLAPGDRALLLYPPGLEFIAAFFGCLYAGVIAVPAYPPRLNDRSQERLRAVARDAEPRAALTTASILTAAAALPIPELAAVCWIATDSLEASMLELPEPDPESIAFLQYTSGSTSTPKGVMVSHANLLHNEGMIGEAFRQDEDTVVVGWLPLYHDMGLIGNVLQPLWAGGTCVLMAPVAFLQKPLRWLEAIHRYRGTTSGGPNFAYELCVRRIAEEQRAGLDLSSWRVAYNGAEPVRAETLERFAVAFAPQGFRPEAFFPCYGLAEATLFVSGGEAGTVPPVAHLDAAALEAHEARPSESEEARRLVSCGHAWAGQRIVVADPETGSDLAAGRIGEIWIAGPSVARGYWRNPEATERDFAARLESGEGPFLRTGDLGFLRDGELYVAGRLKDLIIIRGRNHYPQDLELTAERSHPDLRPGSGAAFSVEVSGEERLVLVQEVERRRRDEFEEVAEAVRGAVAREHEVQVHEVVLVRVGTVPKTSSGKIQRSACRALYLAGELAVVGRSAVASDPAEAVDVSEAAVVPSRGSLLALEPEERRTVLERFLRERAAAAVGVPASAIDPDRPLTGLGLDSLAAIELKSGVETALGVPLSLAGLLEGAGTAELADSLLLALAESEALDAPVLRAWGGELGDQALSYGQKALWFIDRLAPEGGAYNVVVAARARGLDPAVLRTALAALALRHPALRSAFPSIDSSFGDEPVRRVADRAEIDLAVEDAAGWSEARLRERLAEEAYRPFDLGRGPLLRVRVFDRGDGEHALLLAVHHIAVDFASLAVVARDLGALIREAAGGPPAALPALPFGESDFIRWQEEMLAGPRGERLWSWWRDALAGLPDLDLPTDRPRPPVQTYRGGARTMELPVDLADGARALAADRGATLFMVLLAAFQAQLSRTGGQEDLAVGSPSAGRAAELSGVVGYFVNPVTLRADLAGTPSFATLLDRTRRGVLGGLEHGDFPFALLAERLRPARDPARTPLFQVLFLLQRTRPGDEPGLAAFALSEAGGRIDLGGVELESLRLEERRAQFDLTLRVAEEASGRLHASLEFNADLFDATTAERMLGHFRTLLAGALEHPEQAVARLPLLTPAERGQALAASGAAVEEVGYRDDVLLHGLFEEQAERTPEAEALVAGEESLTYAELNHRATELAHQLRRLGVGPEVRVGVRLGRSADLVVSLLGVLKAGGAYVPLDPKYPRERLDLMLEDSGARVMIDQGDPLFLKRTGEMDASGLPPLLSRAPGPGNLAYLIYTSGSTGRPKAVAIEHRSASFLAQWARRVFTPEELSGVLAATSIAFDLSVFEIFVPLAWGGRVILAENALELPRLAARSAVTLVNTVPSAMAELVRSGGVPASVRTVNLAGEPIPPALAEAIHGLPGGVRLYNLYGPSEDTTYSTWTLIAPGSGVTIGRPIDGTWAFVLDPHLEPLPVGVPGELYLGGSGLARGYLGRPELTAERFVPDLFGGLRGEPGARLYRTGDLVRRRPDGDLDFLGRIDHQVKIRGFRVELGEVEEALARHPAVRDVAVLALPEPGGGRRLAAYLVAREGETVEPSALRAFLQERLPEAFVPTGWRVLDALPLSPNGKVDRKELARLAPQAHGVSGAGGVSSSRPQGPVENELAVLVAEALGVAVAEVGRHDDFFALGGHSLLATRVVSRASRLFGVQLPVSALFQAPTVASLAARIAAETGEGAAPPLVPVTPVLRPHEGREDLPLSFAQQRLWFLDRLQPGGTAYNMPGAADLEGALDASALAGALSEVVRRHETLRTRFLAHGGTPVQVVDRAAPLHPPLIDLSALEAGAREELAGELTRAEAARPFDLARGPLLRSRLLRLAPERHRLLLTLHHTVADGWSLGVLMDELAALYGAFAAGRPSPLDELPVQYADFAVWQREWLTGEVLDRQLAWWKEQLAGAPATLDLPADRPRPTLRTITRTQRGGMVRSWLPPVLADGVRDLARRRGSTPFLVLLSAFQTFLARLSGQEDLLVGSVVAGRTRSEIEGLIGFFANTLVLRGDLAGDPTFDEALERARVRTLGAWAHQELPVERLVEELQSGRELGLSPLFQVLFVLQGAPPSLELPGLAVRRVPVTSGGARLDLTLELTEEEGGFAVAWELSRDLFEEATIERFAGWFSSLLTGALADPEQRLSALPLTSGAELEEILVRREAGRRAQESAAAERRRAANEREALQGHDGPRTAVEELLATIWAEVLGVERVGIHDDFFTLGGHSLLATRAVSRIADTLGVDLPLSVLFERPTVARLAERLAVEAVGGGGAPVPPLVRVPRDLPQNMPLPLSFAQQRLWFLDRLAPGGAAYNLAVAAALEGELDAAALERSLGEIVRRHEALRTVFSETRGAETEGRAVQIVRPWVPPVIARRDLSGLPAEERRPAALAEAKREAARPFDLQEGPMVRFLLLAIGPREHLLAATFHHIAADGWSLQVFQSELAELYGAFAAGRPPRLPEPPVQYADFAVWQRRALSGAALHRSLTFWRRRLAGVEPIELPADGARTPTATAPARSHPLDLPQALAADVAELARAEGATPFMVLLAGVYALLARLTGERDLTVGAPVAARNRVEVEGLIGFFANTLPLRVDLHDAAGAPSFREILARVRAAVLEAHAYGDVPFERLVEELQPERVRGRNPLFDVMLAYLSAPSDHIDLPGLRLQPVDLPGAEAKLDLAFTVHERGGSLSGTVEGRGDLFTEATLGRFTVWYRNLLEAALADPETRVPDLSLLTGVELARLLLAGWNEGEELAPGVLDGLHGLHELFEERARLTPDAPALEMDGEVLSYAELNARADRLAARLRGLGVGPETRAAVSLERSPELVTAFLAVWKAGGAVVPIDPAYPRERIDFLLADSGAVVLVSDDALPEALEPGGTAPGVEPNPENLAYVLYTSGSTGQPKGVAVEHGSAAAHLREVIRAYGLGPGERSLFFASPSFDVALEQILAGLLAGATVVLRGRDLWEPADLTRRIAELGLTFVNLPTAYWSRWVRESADLAAAPASLRMVLVGGEEMPAESARLWRSSALSTVRLVNGYGPTETVITATLQDIGDPSSGPVSIGRPLPRRSAHVLDGDGNLLPVGARGELALGGVLARGYLGAPDRTAERFVPDPFSVELGARFYRTGDLVRRRASGELEFLGRIDGQVKVRGFRVEIGEIEAVLRTHPGVREAVVAAVPDAAGSSRLAAWVAPVPGEAPDSSGLRAFLAERLPTFMIPAAWTLLAELPLTPHGKIDRRALPRPSLSTSVEGWVAPRNAVEEALAGVWIEVLGVERVGAYDDFFHLGGHSLLATQLAARARALFGVELPLSELFEAPTLAGMAERIEAARGTGEEVLPPVVRRPRPDGVAPLSFAQQRLWFLHQLDPESPAYNVPGALRLSGPLLPEALESALGEIVRRHEALRTVFGTVSGTEGEPVQRILPPSPFTLPRIDLAGSLDPQAEAERLGLAEARHRFDLAAGPLLRALLVRVAEDEHLLVVVMHHAISDGWSLGVMTGELAALYAAFAAGEPSPLPELPVQYADFAEWQRRTLSGHRLERQLAWWRQLLADPPVLDLPADHRRPPVSSGRGEQLPVALPEDLGRGLRTLARGEGATLYMVLLAGFATLLGRHAGQDDLTVGSPIAGRDRREIEPLIGCFVNTLTLRVRLAGDPSFRELLARVREVTLGAYDHQGVPFERLVEELVSGSGRGRDRARTPLFQVLLVLQNAPRPPLRLGDLLLERRELPTGTAKFDLSLALGDEGEGIAGALEHSSDLFETPSMLRLLGHLTELLRGAVADPGRRLSDLPLLTAGEREQLLVTWNETEDPEADIARGGLLSDLVAAQAARTPEAEAVVGWRLDGLDQEERLTYRELLARADRLASHLVALGVGPEARVGICLERTVDLPVAVLAVLRAGGAYVPLDPAYPQQRLELMLRDSGANVLITQSDLDGRCGPFAGASVWIDEPLSSGPLPERWTAAAPENLAYLIYTSGSTGVPKAVAIEHRSAVVLVRWALREFSAEELAGVLFATSICFDLSVFELFVPLAAGGKVLIAANALELPALPAAQEVTLVNTVPSALAELARRDGFPASVRTVNLAGEPLSGALADAVRSLPGVRRLLNLYGPSEDTTYSTWAEVPASPQRIGEPRIGRPVAGTRVYLLDRDGNPVPEGVPGELFLAGAGLARGYLARPSLTAERFVPDPFSGTPGGRLYRTGDLARWRAAGMLGSRGELEYLGRVDHQVKVRGFRIELGEIEAALARHPAVAEAVVLARDEGERGTVLAAFLVRRPGEAGKEMDAEPRPAELRRFLLRSLPEHMVPTAFVELPALPLTPNGKVDRRTLARLRLDAVLGTGDPRPGSVAPRTPTEELLAALWSEVLGRERVGVEDSFFDLGGHSLLAMRLVSRVRATFGHDLPVARLFESPTIAELARVLDAARGGGSRVAPIRPAPRGEIQGDVPLSFAQERLWFLDRLQPGSAYNLPLAVRLHGPLDRARLREAFGAIVARHEALRTVFPDRDGEPAQRILPPAPASAWPLPLIDLSGLPRPAAEALAKALGQEDGARPFSLLEGPLLRTLLLRLGDREHLLLLNMHHIVSDGWSLGVLLGELAAFYGGTPETLPELPVQYADFAVWQKGWLRGRELERQTSYWRLQLEGSTSVLELPTDRPRPLIATLHGASLPVTVPAELSARLGALARQQGVTPFMLLLAAWSTLLHRWTGQTDLNVGTPIAGRNRSEIEHLVGFFVNTLVLRSDLTEDPDFPELLARTRRTALAAYEHQDLPFEKLVDELRPERDMSRQPLFQVMFVLQNTPLGALELPGGLILDPGVETSTVAKFDLTFSLTERKGELTGSIEYNTDLFDRTTVDRLIGHFGKLLTGIAADPGRPLSALPILGETERHQLLLEWAECRTEPSHCLHEVIERQVDRAPGLSAVEFDGVAWTYRELDRRANRLAWHLRAMGVGPEVRVALCMERGADMIVGMLGVLKAGGAYVPLDPAYPQERLIFLLGDCGARILLTQERMLDRLPESGSRVVCIDRDWEEIARHPDVRPASGVTVRNPAYVIYTSGSTGIPKGIVTPHEAVQAYTRVSSLVYATGPGHRILQISSISFDASIEEIYCTLTRGATLVVRGESHEGASEFLERCRRERITMLQMTTAYWHQVAAAMEVEGLELPPDLRVLFVGGEKMLSQRLVAWWKLVPPDLRFVNAYGPTETTVAITLCPFPGRVPIDESLHDVPLGRPVPYARAYVLDRWLQPVPIGTVGELCFGGISLARGYLDRPALTASRFIPNPFAGLGAGAGERVYRTGDLVRLRPDSLLEFVGRTDHQVKIRGYRIELGEIEATLASHPGVGEVVVMTREDAPGEVRLVAFVAGRGGREETVLTVAELRSFLEERLPAYMIPPTFQVLPALPVNSQGKVDRGALARLTPRVQRERSAFAAPRNELEATIAAVWREVFGLGEGEPAGEADTVGIHDNFFDAGGSSLSLVKLHSRLQKALERTFPLVELFKHPTIAALAASLGTEAPAKPTVDQARARTDTRRESMRQLQQLREQRRSRKPGR